MAWRLLLMLIVFTGCQAYRSKGGTDRLRIACDPVRCAPNCREAIGGPNGCPTCLCDPLCSPPKCPPGCEIEKEPKGPCPECDCSSKDDSPPEPVCDPVKCGPDCREVPTPTGCPSCVCGPECVPPACPRRADCQIKTVPGEPCPVCRCSLPICEPLECGRNCYYARSPDKCPTCVCNPKCPIPACPLMVGCEVTIVPGETCPVCRCASQVRPLPGCDPVKCSPGCREVTSPTGCPFCDCKPLCSPPKCDEPGCEIKQLPGEPCPSCECKKGPDRPLPGCDPVKCSAGCREVLTPNGCPSCHCGEPLCSPPKCDEPGCEIKQLPGEPCPSCECKQEPACSSAEECRSKGPMCSLRPSKDGCDSCVCRPICDPPRCRRGCRIKYPESETECPFCECKGPVKYGKKFRPICAPPLCPEREGCRLKFLPDRICPICECPNRVCEPVKCESGCVTETDPYGCPSCFCPECAPPFCPERKGCFLKNVSGMSCPQCECPTLDVQCAPPLCPGREGCHLKNVPRKICPICECPDKDKLRDEINLRVENNFLNLLD